jgi:hypothetical protein
MKRAAPGSGVADASYDLTYIFRMLPMLRSDPSNGEIGARDLSLDSCRLRSRREPSRLRWRERLIWPLWRVVD